MSAVVSSATQTQTRDINLKKKETKKFGLTSNIIITTVTTKL